MKLSSILYFFVLFLFQFLSETRGNQIRVVLFKHTHHTGWPTERILPPDKSCLPLDESERKASSVRLLEGSCVLLCTKGCRDRRHEREDCFILTSEVKHLQQYNDQLQSIKHCGADFERFRYFMVEDENEDSSRDEREGPGPGPGQGRELRDEKHSRSHNSYKVPIKHSDNNLSNFPRKRRHGKLDKYLYKYKH